jgi:hypothetical protein
MKRRSARIGCISLMTLLAALGIARALLADNADNTVEGTIVARSETTIDLLSDGDKQPARYLLNPASAHFDPKVLEFIKSLKVGTEVRVKWSPYQGKRLVHDVFVIAAAGSGGGLVQGTVTAIAVNNTEGMKYIEVKDDSGKTEQYSPQWTGKGFDENMLKAIAKRQVGERVQIRIAVDDHPRVVTMIVTALAPAASLGGDSGTVVGRVTAKDKASITLKNDAGSEEMKLLAQDVVGVKDEQDRAMVKAIAGLKTGDKLEAQWFRDGERRLVWIKVAGSPTSAPVRAPATGKT